MRQSETSVIFDTGTKETIPEDCERITRNQTDFKPYCDALARLLIAQTQYIEITEQIRETPLMEDVPVYETRENPDTGEKERVQVGTRQVVNGERERLMIIQDRCMKQCRQGASDFGLTVSSRCRLVVPKPQQQKPENKFAKYAN